MGLYTLVVLCLYLTITQADDASIIGNILKRMDKFEEQGVLQQQRIAQQDKLLELYERQLRDQANRIQLLEIQLLRTRHNDLLPANESPSVQADTVDLTSDMSNADILVPVDQIENVNNPADSREELIFPINDKPAGNETFSDKELTSSKHAEGRRGASRIKRALDKVIERTKTSRLILDSAEGPIAFHATNDLGSTPVGLNQHIIFEDVHLDLGNAFHELHGLFIAPKSGIYLFSTSIMTHVSNGDILAQITKNGVALARAYAFGGNAYDQGSVSVVTQLNIGDEIWVSSYDRTTTSEYGDEFTSFMGVLIIET